jgi:ATP-dependent helicase HrpA
LTPAPQFADAALEHMGPDRGGPMLDALASALNKLTGVELSRSSFEEVAIPDHLRFRVVLTDSKGKVAAVSRDLAALQQELGGKARRRFMDQQGSRWNIDGATGWEFGELPVTVRTPSGNTAWPALQDQQTAVGLRLFESADDAAWAHLEGVRRLLSLTLKDKLAYLEKHHGIGQRALAAWSPVGSVSSLVCDLAWSSLCTVGDPKAVAVRDERAFSGLVTDCRSAIGAEFQRSARLLEDLLSRMREVMAMLTAELAARLPEPFEDIESQLHDLVYDGFLRDLEPGRLRHYPRYLEAMRLRLERMALDPARDARLMNEVSGFWNRYLEHIHAGAEYGEELDRFRWLLEEYRVSVFAQQLGTAQKTSAKRLSEAWRKVPGTTSGA